MNNGPGYDLRRPGDAAEAIASIEQSFHLGTGNELRSDLDEIRMAFEALDAYRENGYTQLRRPANGEGDYLIGVVDEAEETVSVSRSDDPDGRPSRHSTARELSFEALEREENDGS